MTSPEQRLHQQLESAIQEFLLASRAQVAATLDRAFDTAAARSSASRLKSATRRQQVPKLGKRRSASELTALSEQLYEVIAAHPGQGMVVLSERVGTSGPHLQRVVSRLRTEGRIRTVGARQQTRYFPRA
jgi:hypothetical protein